MNNEIEIVESFRTLAKNIVNFFENNLQKTNDISCSELSALEVLYNYNNENKKMNVTELANILNITKSAASQLVSKLERKNFIKRKINLFDKKINYISINDESKKIYQKKKEEYKEIVNKVIDKMGEQDSQKLSSLLKKLSDIIYGLGKGDINA